MNRKRRKAMDGVLILKTNLTQSCVEEAQLSAGVFFGRFKYDLTTINTCFTR